MLISPAIFNCSERDALKDKMKLVDAELHAPRIQVKGRHFEGAFFQPPVEDREAALLIDQHFQVRAGLVDEDKSVSLGDLSPQLIGDNTTEKVEPFAHIGLLPVKMIGPVIAQRDQATHDISSLRYAALTGW